jgi:hypothetical protein
MLSYSLDMTFKHFYIKYKDVNRKCTFLKKGGEEKAMRSPRLMLLSVAFVALVAFYGCTQDEFYDDFEDDALNPVYHFVVGDPSSVMLGPCNEGGGCLFYEENAYFFLPYIPEEPPFVRTHITPGVSLDLDVWGVFDDSILELGIANDMEDVSDYFSLKLEGEESPGRVSFTCYDEADSFSVEGITLFSPYRLSIHADEDGRITGSYSGGFATYECPLSSAISSDTLYPAIVMWSPLGEGSIEVDNFHVSLD